MNERVSFFRLRNHKTQDGVNATLQAVLEALPQAALILNGQSAMIEAVNTPLIETSGYTRQDFSFMGIKHIFSAADCEQIERAINQLQSLPITLQNVQLNNRHGTTVAVKLTLSLLPPEKRLVFISIEKDSHLQQLGLLGNDNSYVWDHLHSLVSVPNRLEFLDALQAVLSEARLLSEASVLAIYLAESHHPKIDRIAQIGPDKLLPEFLPAQDLAHLNTAQVWQSGKRTGAAIHRTARSHRLKYLATAPLGQAKAQIGLVAIGSEQSEPMQHIVYLTSVLAACINIIVQEHIQEQWRLSQSQEMQFELLAQSRLENSISQGLILLEPDLSIRRLNDQAVRIFGYTHEEAQGRSVQQVLISSDALDALFEKARAGVPSLAPFSLRLFRRNGENFPAQVRLVPVEQEGALRCVYLLIEDLIEQEQLRSNSQQLEQRATLGEFTAIFAHEVRNPINNISTGLQLMAVNLAEQDPNQETIERLLQDCDRLANLMKSVLAFSKPAQIEEQPIDVKAMLQRLVDRTRLRLQRYQVAVEINIAENTPLIVGDYRQLEQVFFNLMSNSLQAMENTPNGKLTIKALPYRTLVQTEASYREINMVRITVADSGPGIPKDIQDKIFQPFFTTHRSGNGLGLAITKQIITAHKGNIWVDSVPGGAVFYIELPALEGKPGGGLEPIQ